MNKPTTERLTMAQLDKRLALMEQGRTHDRETDGERNEAILEAIKALSDKVQALTKSVDTEVADLKEKQQTTEHRLDTFFAEAKGTVRGVKIGWAGAFAVIGAGLFATVEKLVEWLT